MSRRKTGRPERPWRYLALVCIAIVAMSAQAESLFRESGFRGFTVDNKAARIGDVLTVQVFENSTASTSTDTGTRRKNNIGAEATYGKNNFSRFAVGAGGDFDGGGSTQRSNRILATLTVSVREIMPNGDLLVSGEQHLMVNQEPQRVTLEGRVRPADISDGNVVISTRLADARITYVGEGDLSERGLRPWWRKLLDWIGF